MQKPKLGMRRPQPQPDPAAVEQFVARGPERPAVQTSGNPDALPVAIAAVSAGKRPEAQTSENSEVRASETPKVQTPERSEVQTSGNPGVQQLGLSSAQTAEGLEVQVPGLVTRNGRNGKGARVRRRMTVYLPPELAQRLEDRAHATRTEISEIVAAALEKHL